MIPHASPSVRVDPLWTFHYRLSNGDRRQAEVRNHDFHAACFEFHAIAQLVQKLERYGYIIDRVVSDHTHNGNPVPQTYDTNELPAINPDASTFTLPLSLAKKIYPDAGKSE